MKNESNQLTRIINGFITASVIIISVSLIAAGIATSKVNSEYMETGVRAAKIVAERENEQISLSLNDTQMYSGEGSSDKIEVALSLMPPPVNTGYYIFCGFCSLVGADNLE